MEEKINELLQKFRALDTRHKIQLGVLAAVAIMVIIAFFFIKSSFGKITIDRSEIQQIQAERDSLRKEREALRFEIQYFNSQISRQRSTDSALVTVILRQNASLNNINNKISTLNNAKKKPADYSNVSSDSLERFFSGLSN